MFVLNPFGISELGDRNFFCEQEKFNKELQAALFNDRDSLFNKLSQSQLAKTDLQSALLDALA